MIVSESRTIYIEFTAEEFLKIINDKLDANTQIVRVTDVKCFLSGELKVWGEDKR